MIENILKKSSVFLLLIYIFFFGCNDPKGTANIIDFQDSIDFNKEVEKESELPIYIAIASMTSPKETFVHYSQLIKYLSTKLGRTILIKQKKTYEEVNELIKKGQVDFAFVCSGAFVELAENKSANLLVAPVINDKTYYQAYIIATKDSEINSFGALKGRSFAFTDPLSNTGYLYPQNLLKRLKTHSRKYFSKTLFTYGHDISIQMINRGVLDGASVHGLIYDFIAEMHPENVKNIKIIKKSDWFAMPPVVTSRQLDRKQYEIYKDLFVNIHKDSIGLAILNNLKIEKFESIESSIFESVQKMKDYVDNK